MSGIKTKIIFIMTVWVFFLSAPVLAGDRFTDNGDGTVTDHQLGVMWAKTDNQGNINWNDANQWVEFTFPYTITKQYDNWRLPTLAELKSLYVPDKAYKGYETDCGQLIKTVPEIKLSCGWIWTRPCRSHRGPSTTWKPSRWRGRDRTPLPWPRPGTWSALPSSSSWWEPGSPSW